MSLTVYSEYLRNLINDMRDRFEDKSTWVLNPFDDVIEMDETIHEELLDVQNEEKLKLFSKDHLLNVGYIIKLKRVILQFWQKEELFHCNSNIIPC